MPASGYRQALRSAVRALWTEAVDRAGFLDIMETTIRRWFTTAWNEGASECGIKPEELIGAETIRRDELIRQEFGYVFSGANPLIDAIWNNRQSVGGKLTPLLSRLEMWVNTYNRIVDTAASMACINKKKVFRLGRTERHCRSCSGFNGRVYRYETWADNNAMPRSRALCCTGIRCDCTLEDTDSRITPGPFPRGLLCG